MTGWGHSAPHCLPPCHYCDCAQHRSARCASTVAESIAMPAPQCGFCDYAQNDGSGFCVPRPATDAQGDSLCRMTCLYSVITAPRSPPSCHSARCASTVAESIAMPPCPQCRFCDYAQNDGVGGFCVPQLREVGGLLRRVTIAALLPVITATSPPACQVCAVRQHRRRIYYCATIVHGFRMSA